MIDLKRGDIVFGKKNSDAYHPILFLENKNDTFFIGAMLTKSSDFGNINLLEKHIVKYDNEGNEFPFKYNNTHFVKAKLLKKLEWAPFKKIGEINLEGIHFIEENIKYTQEQIWEEYNNGNDDVDFILLDNIDQKILNTIEVYKGNIKIGNFCYLRNLENYNTVDGDILDIEILKNIKIKYPETIINRIHLYKEGQIEFYRDHRKRNSSKEIEFFIMPDIKLPEYPFENIIDNFKGFRIKLNFNIIIQEKKLINEIMEIYEILLPKDYNIDELRKTILPL